MELLRREVLTMPVSARAIPMQADLRQVSVGKREDGGAWKLPVPGTPAPVAGSTGSGKGSVTWPLRALAPRNRRRIGGGVGFSTAARSRTIA